jgi:RHH-type rel operon transcriptional repressor/antitoxin RelB
MTSTLTIQLDDDLKQRLDQLAADKHQASDTLVSDVLKDFVELHEWQMQERKTRLRKRIVANLPQQLK